MSYTNLRYKTLEDWIRLRPIIGLYKIVARRSIGLAYVLKPAPDPAALKKVRQQLGTRPLIVTVAYNSVWILKWQIKFGDLNFRDVDRLVADNSSNPEAAREVETLCRDMGVAYIKLPFNRFSLGRPYEPSLSHASALNWVWRNIVKPAKPPLVALLDHDLIPLHPVDFNAKVREQPFYGAKVVGHSYGWQIWPGYAVYDRSIVDRYRPDFWVDIRARMDTGGANWQRIYRHFDMDRLQFADLSGLTEGRLDEWWHVGGASEYRAKADNWRENIEARLEREYDACAKDARSKPGQGSA